MSASDFIPAGRTSRIVKGNDELQIQTEYACRPSPRLTTSVITGGRVIHKIQRDLAAPISSLDEKADVEKIMRKQHFDVIEIVRDRNFNDDVTVKENSVIETKSLSLQDRLSLIKGVERVYRLDYDGQFDPANVSPEFKKKYSALFKNIREVIEIFGQLPGGKREKGVCEIDAGRLCLISTGYECYFLLARRMVRERSLEKEIGEILAE